MARRPLTLDVLIATHTPTGIHRVEGMGLPRVEGVRYVVTWQGHEGAPVPQGLAGRGDVEIYRTDSRGLSNNRNCAMGHARADIILFADDDITYTPGGLRAVKRVFEEDPTLGMATFRHQGPVPKSYPAAECRIGRRLPAGYYVSAIEMAVRRDSPAGALRFDPQFGIGSTRWSVGEDSMFLLAARRRGVNISFFPIIIAAHPSLTTGTRPMTATPALRGTGACIALEYPLTWPLRIPLKVWREWRAGRMSPGRGLAQLTAGALDATLRYTPPWREE